MKQELSDQLKSLKNELVKTNDKKLKEQLILKKCQLQITYKIETKELIKKYKIDKEQLKVEYNKSLSDYESKVKNLKQNLSQEINKVNSDINLQLQAVINNKNDKVGVNWAQFFQENKALNHYIYKQYNAIWKKGKIGNWNNFQQEIKTIYGESLNMYINEKMKYENNVYNYKQDLIREIVLL
ncbi:hypothetical protein [Spiroplasma endosymbiont of Zeiraphera isertana]|uniref:hypothetical protein n=1 Tax=Spiroplasma endosymbiont of Zeiraphera isertana TaxID=3066313 RepID=UPI00313C5923